MEWFVNRNVGVKDMSEIVTLELPEEVARSAKHIAEKTHRRIEDVLVEWLDRTAAELPVDMLPDDEIVALCDLEMDADQNDELSDLLAHNRENHLSAEEQQRLDELMQLYRYGLIRKAQAIKTAVERGLKPRLS
jgi:hypothetical protein